MDGIDYPPVSPLKAGLACRCPRCGRGKLFSGYLTVGAACGVCGLDLSAQDSGDGPAVFIIMILGFIVVGLAFWVDVSFTPPLWVHAILWPPVILGGALAMLRPLKALMVALQFRHRRHTLGGSLPDCAAARPAPAGAAPCSGRRRWRCRLWPCCSASAPGSSSATNGRVR